MKKFLIFLSAAALFLAGCAEEIQPPAGDADTFTAEFTVEAQADATKAITDNDGFAAGVDECLVQIWMKTGSSYELYSKPQVFYNGDNRHYKFSATFIKNQNYKILVWADKSGRYTFADDATVSRNEAINNFDDLDAFFANVDIDASKAITNRSIIARRPFAQLNVITTDLPDIPAEHIPTSVGIEYEAPVSMNLLTQELGAAQTISIKNSPVYYPGTTGTAAESTLSMDYIFAPEEREIKDFKYSINYTEPVEREFTNIPVQRNYRTNIYGRLLAAGEEFQVIIDPIWNQEEDNTDIDVIAMIGSKGFTDLDAAIAEAPVSGTNKTEIRMTGDYTGKGSMVSAGQDIVIDLGGFTYSVDDASLLAGSASTKNQVLHIDKGAALTIKNGTITSTVAKMLIQNYGDLTLEDVIVDATGSPVCTYAISNNCGNVNLIGSTAIYTDGSTKAADGAKAFDACWAPNRGYPEGAQVTVNTTGIIEGDIEFDLWGVNADPCLTTIDIFDGTFTGKFVITGIADEVAASNINIYGGKFLNAPDVTLLAPGYVVEHNGTHYSAAHADFVIGGVAYDSIEDAFDTIEEGQTITVACTGSLPIPADLPAGVTIEAVEGYNAVFNLSSTSYSAPEGITFKNISFTSDAANATTGGAVTVAKGASFEGCTFKFASYYGVVVSSDVEFKDCDWDCNGLSRGIMVWGGTPVITVDGCTFDCTYPYNVDSGTPSTTFKSCELNGWTSYGNGTVSFDGCKFGKSTSGSAYCRPYVDTIFTNCEFSSEFLIDFGAAGLTFTMNGCKQNGAVVTTSIVEPDLSNPGILVIDGVSHEMSKTEQ